MSIAGTLQKVSNEPELRNVVGDWLRNRNHGKYSVPQEDELADGTRPDLRIYAAHLDAPVPVELKIADNGSANKLAARIGSQLIAKYLRDQRSRCGLYLVFYRGGRSYWQHPGTGEHLRFESLVKYLASSARSAVSRAEGVDAIEVVGVDLTIRGAMATR